MVRPSSNNFRRPAALMKFIAVPALFLILAAGRLSAVVPDAVVASDGSGRYTSVQAAISAAPLDRQVGPRWTILVKPGTYRERVYVQRERGNIRLVGEDAATTIITTELNATLPGRDGKPNGTNRTPTCQVDGDGFEAENLTIANGAGPVGQALALRVDGDRVAFRHCRFLGWQDTLLVNRGRQYFADCYIEGHVDFIFGGATAYFERCEIHCLKDGYITAASTPQDQAYGFVFADCRIDGAPGVKTYLGRPWRDYAATIFIRTEMSEVVRPAGWHDWHKPQAQKTARYAEFANTGPGATRTGRVAWAQRLGSGAAAGFTPAVVLAGADGWNPAPGPALHLVGDSTMADKANLDYPERGWGQALRAWMRPPWRLINHAVNGRSTKSFRTLGDWQRTLDQVHAGDWVLIEFGHNDEKRADPARYADPATDYPENLRAFVREVRAKGAHPVLATPVVRRDWDDRGQLVNTHGAYPAAVRAVAAEDQVPLLDLEALTRELVTKLGPEKSKGLYQVFAPGEHPLLPDGKTDNTHFRPAGARDVAALAVGEIRRLQLPLAKAFLTDLPDPAWAAETRRHGGKEDGSDDPAKDGRNRPEPVDGSAGG
jgi:pectinesterase